MHTVHAACPHDCPDTCAMSVTTEGERIVRIQGRADHPSTAGVLCTKVSRYAERTDHPERVLTPLKRVGRKGEGRFEPVSWDEALDAIAARLQALPPEAVLPYSYAGTMGLVQGDGMAARFFHRLGASLLDRTICASAGALALKQSYGASVGMHLEAFAQSRLILIWGSNAIGANLHFWRVAQEAKRAGARLVAIDPRRSETAEKCHQHIALRPGTDGALALGLMHELIVHDWLDHDYLARHVEGWPALRERALQWPPARVAATCGLTEAEVQDLARDYAHTRPAAIRLNYGMQRVHGGGNAVRLITLLPCLTGAWREAGGGLLLSASGWAKRVVRADWLQRPDLLAGRTPRTLNMSALADWLQRDAAPDFGPRVQALIVYNANPMAVLPDSRRVAQALAREDLFTVVLEHFLTDTADHADYVLPATTQLEHWDAHTSYGHTSVLLNEPAIAPRGQARSNAEVFRQLAARMGYTDACFADSDEAMARGAFSAEVDAAELARQGWFQLPLPAQPFADGGFFTPSGKAVACNADVPLPDHVPNHECAEATPALAARYPLALITPPSRHFLNSTFVNVKSLRDMEGEPQVEIHPHDAAARGIADGQHVRVFNDRGEYHGVARVGNRARPGVVNALGVWWRKMGWAGTNVNELTHGGLTDLGGAPSFHDALVDVAPL
ncbi:MAG: molybdopterin oxidoreductase family protein [Proteobacteria bacterium]|nr:molybdopterin oxidoreductase family protein [Pseudomonadota bacterium]